MVKHGRNKKRRAGRLGRTKLKNKNFHRWDPKPKINDATVKNLWDANKSPSQNLASMGLSMEPNGISRGHVPTINPAAVVNAIELFDIPDSDGPSNRDQFPLNAEEQEYIVKCLQKCGTNYAKMFRNTKVNTLQHTQEKLQKLGARFLLLNPNQVLIDEIPDKVLQLMDQGKEIAKELEERREKAESE